MNLPAASETNNELLMQALQCSAIQYYWECWSTTRLQTANDKYSRLVEFHSLSERWTSFRQRRI